MTPEQQDRLAEVKDATEGEDLILDIDGLHPLIDRSVGTVERPCEGWRTEDLTALGLFVFDRAPKLVLTAASIAADHALRRDSAYGL